MYRSRPSAQTVLIKHLTQELHALHRLLSVREQQRALVDAASDLRVKVTRQWCHEQLDAMLVDVVSTGAGADAARRLGVRRVEPSSEALYAEVTAVYARIDELEEQARRCVKEQRYADSAALERAVRGAVDDDALVDDAAVVDAAAAGGAGGVAVDGDGDDVRSSAGRNGDVGKLDAGADDDADADLDDKRNGGGDKKRGDGNGMDESGGGDSDASNSPSDSPRNGNGDDVSSISTVLPQFEQSRLGGDIVALQEALAAREEELRTLRLETEERLKEQFRTQYQSIKRDTIKTISAFANTLKLHNQELRRQMDEIAAERTQSADHVAFQKSVLIQVEERLQFLSQMLEEQRNAMLASPVLAALHEHQRN